MGSSRESNYRWLNRKLEILVIRHDKLGNLKNSKPCNHCLATLRLFGIRNVYYSNDDGNIEKYRLDDIIADFPSSGQRNYYRFLDDQHKCLDIKRDQLVVKK